MKRFPLKRVTITGSGSGIGRAMALEFAGKGWKVAVNDIHLKRAQETLELIKQAGGGGMAVQCDVTRFSELENLATRLDQEWGGVDIIINNAGVAAGGFMEEHAVQDWEWLLGVNLMGVVHGCKAFIPVFDRQGQGHIVNIASAAGIACLPEMSIYNVSKAAVISLSETLRVELSVKHIGVTVVCPSFFKTDLLSGMLVTHKRQKIMAENAMADATVTAEEVAKDIYRAVEKDRFFVTSMKEIKRIRRFKRFLPETFLKVLSKAYRRGYLDKFFRIDGDCSLATVRPPK
jgi:NADP-dependent 3-hydroxy acid dehydrogenase YdfG